MSTPRTIDTYGGVFTDETPVENPTTEQSAAQYTRHAEDSAQLTRSAVKSVVRFQTTVAAAPAVVVASSGRSQMGTGGGALPTISKTAPGVYAITYATPWTDGLGESENVAFVFSHGAVSSLATKGRVQTTESANVITAWVLDTSDAASDLGGSVDVTVFGY